MSKSRNDTFTARRIAVMQAWLDGKDIEYRRFGDPKWRLVGKSGTEPMWSPETQYRIAPEPPREFWVNVYSDDEFYIHNTEEKAVWGKQRDGEVDETVKTIKVIEVRDDE